MVVVVSLNPSVDWQYDVPNFLHGGMNRVKLTRQDVAGKGINVCVALKNLKLNPLYMGFNFIENGDLLIDKLSTAQIEHDLITLPGAIRVNIKLYEKATKSMTELNQPGASVSAQSVKKLSEKIKQNTWNVEHKTRNAEQNILILTGSCPQGVKDDFYSQVCQNWYGKVILDTEGEALRKAVESSKPPYAIKPNLYELQNTFGVKSTELKEIALFCRDLITRTNVQLVCVSLGVEGAVMVSPTFACYCPAFDVKTKGVHGAGDAMVAGLAYGLQLQKDISGKRLFSYMMSAATATVSHEGTNMCTYKGFKEILDTKPHLRFENILD